MNLYLLCGLIYIYKLYIDVHTQILTHYVICAWYYFSIHNHMQKSDDYKFLFDFDKFTVLFLVF